MDCPAAIFYRVTSSDWVRYCRNRREVRTLRALADNCGDRVIVHKVTLTSRLTPKRLALALLNNDPAAFATEEPYDAYSHDSRRNV